MSSMQLRSGRNLHHPVHQPPPPIVAANANAAVLANTVLNNLGLAHIVQRIVSFSMNLHPDDHDTHVVRDISELDDQCKEERVVGSFRSYQALALQLVHPIWYLEFKRIASRYDVVYFPFGVDEFHIPAPRPSLRRLLFHAPSFSPYDLPALETQLACAPLMTKLHIRLQSIGAFHNVAFRHGLEDVMTQVLREGCLRVFRWSGPPIDILSCASTSYLESLVLDSVPAFSNGTGEHIILVNLKQLVVNLAFLISATTPLPDVFSVLCRSYVPTLQDLVVTGISKSADLEEFIHLVAPTLQSISITEGKDEPTEKRRALPSIPNLHKCTLMVDDAKFLLSKPQVKLQYLHLSSFDRSVIQDRQLRKGLLCAIFDLVSDICQRKSADFPRLRVVRLRGITDYVFRHTYWYQFEEALFGYSFLALQKVGACLVGEDDLPLYPNGNTYRLMPSNFTYGSRFCPFV